MRFKTLIAMCATVALGAGQMAADVLPHWKNVKVTSVNREDVRSSFMTFDTRANALTGDYAKSEYYQLLNGTWKFYYVGYEKDLPAGLTDKDVNTSTWHDIKVPGNWELQGFGDAIYTNIPYDFCPKNPQPPAMPDENPVGVYRRDFDIPESWLDREIFIHLSGAKSGVYVYINGEEVGYNNDSKVDAEYHINKYVKAGKNQLAIKIYRYSVGSYLECQDFWRISGIERDVFVYSQPKVSVKDYHVVSTLDEACKDGVFKLAVDLKNATASAQDVTVGYELLDASGAAVKEGAKTYSAGSGVSKVEFAASLPGVKTWSSEAPNLYKLLITVKRGDKVVEYVPQNVGFRRIEIKTLDEKSPSGRPITALLINGKPIKLKGVNIHEHNPATGHYVPEALMRKDFELMKRNNINAVRLCHYPQDHRFYELCDEYGLYVYDEANIESHAMGYGLSKGGTLGNNPEWLEQHKARIANMFWRDKNHPCVTIWSLGNEAGNGYNFYEGYRMLKELESGYMNRPVCYERAEHEWNTDMIVPQYPGAEYFHRMGVNGSDRPVCPSEYAHAMGNSTGSLWDQWKEIYAYTNLQGGFIWDWVDQGFDAVDENGVHYFTYGGDYGKDRPSDANFLCNGIVNPDRDPHPGMAEVKYAYADIAFDVVDAAKGEFKIKNRLYFTSTKNYQFSWQLLENGKPIRTGKILADVEPQGEKIVMVPLKNLKPGREYFVVLSASTLKATKAVPAGHEVAHDQFCVQASETTAALSAKGAPLSISSHSQTITISSKDVTFTFDKSKGMVTSYNVKGTEYFKDGFGIQPNFWRGPTDNDYGNGMPHRLQVWKTATNSPNVAKADAAMDGKNGVLSIDYALPTGNVYKVVYTVSPSGAVKVAAEFGAVTDEALVKNNVPRVGVRFRMPVAMSGVEYYGRGPEENYVDRKKGTMIGLFKADAADMAYDYVRPQECGHHTDTRWLSLTTKKGKGLKIVADGAIEFNALRNSVEDYDTENNYNRPRQWSNFSKEEIASRNEEAVKNKMRHQTHINDITPRDYVEVCIDGKHAGLGGYDSWGSRPEQQYLIPISQTHSFGFTIIPQ